MTEKNLIDDILNNPDSIIIEPALPIINILKEHLKKITASGKYNLNYTILFDMISSVINTINEDHIESIHETCALLNKITPYFYHTHINKLTEIHALILKFQKILQLTTPKLSKKNAMLLQVLGQIERDLSLATQAKNHLEESIAILYKLTEPCHSEIATGLSRLGNVYRDLGDLNATYIVLSQALELEISQHGPRHRHVALTRNDFGKLLRDMKKHRAAETEFKNALSILQETLGTPFHSDYARCLGNHGTNYLQNNQHYKAYTCLKKALYIQEKITPNACFHKAITHNNLAKSLIKLKQIKDAKTHFNIAITYLQTLKENRQKITSKRNQKTDLLLQKIHKKQQQIHETLTQISPRKPNSTPVQYQYINSFNLKPLKAKLEALLKNPHPEYGETPLFCDYKLTLTKLATLLSDILKDSDSQITTTDARKEKQEIRPYELSEFINTTYAQNFCSFINQYRVEEAKKQLLNNPDLTTLNISYRVGFSSLSAFSNAFKRIHKISPGKYRKTNTLNRTNKRTIEG